MPLKAHTQKLINVMFYYFLKSSIVPSHLLTKNKWQDIYDNFRVLRSNQQNSTRTALKEIKNGKEYTDKIQDLPPRKRKTINKEIGDYFDSPEASLLFNPTDDKSVEYCLSQRIDLFDEIITNKEDLSVLVNRASEEENQLTVKQGIIIIQRLQFFRMSYLNILNCNINEPISFKNCEIFPHPNYYVEMGKSDQPVFLETFPEVKLELSR